MILAYNSNLHPAESAADIFASCRRFGGAVRAELGWDQVGIDLRLSLQAINELQAQPGAAERYRQQLAEVGLVVTTINAFPLNPFQSEVVKQGAYKPDWFSAERQQATRDLIALSCALTDQEAISISTLPGSYGPWASSQADIRQFAQILAHWAQAALEWHKQSGRTVVLCPEPEPWCMLADGRDGLSLWRDHLWSDEIRSQVDEVALQQHLALCWDTCHSSLAFEDQPAVLADCAAVGARPYKVQVSAAPEIRDPATKPQAVAALADMAEPRFLHQSAALAASGSQVKVSDLNALPQLLQALPGAALVRSHFHVPLHLDELGPGLSTTAADTAVAVRAALTHGATDIAVETYTWSILARDQQAAIRGTADELRWLQQVLSASDLSLSGKAKSTTGEL